MAMVGTSITRAPAASSRRANISACSRALVTRTTRPAKGLSPLASVITSPSATRIENRLRPLGQELVRQRHAQPLAVHGGPAGSCPQRRRSVLAPPDSGQLHGCTVHPPVRCHRRLASGLPPG